MSNFYVKIVDGHVKECWDTPPPAGETGWKSAIEVRPPITKLQYHTSHTFDITKDPVEIVYGVEDITVMDRKNLRKQIYKEELQRIVNGELRREEQFPLEQLSAAVISAAREEFQAKMAALNAITTHDQLDELDELDPL